MIEEGISQLLMGDVGIQAICAGRLFAVTIPDDAVYPCISYQVIDATPDATMDGPSGMDKKRIQIDCWAGDYPTSKELQQAVKTLLGGFQGNLPDGTRCDSILRDNEDDFFEDVSRLFRATTDYLVTYTES